MDLMHATLGEIRAKAAELRQSFGDDARARALEWAAECVERAIRAQADERLTLAEASGRSGYSQDHLSRLMRKGKLRNAGRRGAPRIRAGDLPNRSVRSVVAGAVQHPYDPATDARTLRLDSRLGGIANGDSPAESH
jgi:hypothetical protein